MPKTILMTLSSHAASTFRSNWPVLALCSTTRSCSSLLNLIGRPVVPGSRSEAGTVSSRRFRFRARLCNAIRLIGDWKRISERTSCCCYTTYVLVHLRHSISFPVPLEWSVIRAHLRSPRPFLARPDWAFFCATIRCR